MPHSDDSNQELAPVMHFQQALSLSSSSLSLGRQGRWMGLWGQDTVREGTFLGVLNVSLCALGAQLGLDMFAQTQCNVSVFWIFIKLVGLMIITKPSLADFCSFSEHFKWSHHFSAQYV